MAQDICCKLSDTARTASTNILRLFVRHYQIKLFGYVPFPFLAFPSLSGLGVSTFSVLKLKTYLLKSGK